jgi:phosphoglycolate phosphatase
VTDTLASLNGVTVVFDLDGTLVDTAPDLVATLNVLLTQEGIATLTLAEARDLIGQGARALIAKGFAAAGRPLDPARLDGLFDRFITHYRAHIADASRPFPGVRDALGALKAAGAVLSVCTNKRTDLSVALLQALDLAGDFRSIIGADAAPASKPDPRHLLTAIAAAGGDPARAIMVGDSGSDAGAAKAAGTPLVLVTFGYTETPVATLGADILIDSFDEIPAACAGLAALFERP